MVQGTSNTMVFEHSSAPASVKPSHSKTKYRDDDESPLPLSSDPRVIRGSTTVLARKVASSKRSTAKMSRSLDNADFGRQLPRPSYQFEVQGHVGPDIDLTPYLIAKDDGVATKKKEVISQTDTFKDRPATPDYQPRKIGVDGATQVEDVRELFDFDAESDPIVSVIVGKTLEQAIFEVQHEEEMLALERQATDFHGVIEAEKQWQHSREADTIAEMREHRDQLNAAQSNRNEELRVTTTVAGSQMIKQLLPGIFETVVEGLYDDNSWRRPERADVEENCFFPARDGLRLSYKANGECMKIIDELAAEASKLYEDKTHILSRLVDARMILLHMKPPDVEVAEGEEAPAPVKKVEPTKIWGNVSMIDIIAIVRKETAELEIPMYEALTLPALHDFFFNITGRTIAKDGAIMNFDKLLPEENYYFPV